MSFVGVIPSIHFSGAISMKYLPAQPLQVGMNINHLAWPNFLHSIMWCGLRPRVRVGKV